MADDWFDRLVDQDWAGETETPTRRDRTPGETTRLPPPGQVIDLGDPTDETETPETSKDETSDRRDRDRTPEHTETDPVDLSKNETTAASDSETSTADDTETSETETERAQRTAYEHIADALIAAAARLPTAEDAAEARRDVVRSARARAAAYSISAALAGFAPALLGAGWNLPGVVRGWLDGIAAEASIGAALLIGAALAGIVWAAWDRRTRNLPGWLAWTCRIPLASIVAGVLLWAPAWPALNL
jgi:hypothetical protein